MNKPSSGERALIADLGLRLAQTRVARNLTQMELADAAAVSKRTIERLETGQSVQLSNLVRALTALGLADHINLLAPVSGPRPMDLFRHQGKSRKRASTAKAVPTGPWSWGDKRT
ncbi:MAG: helix-turn-helix domain-containing protein [Alphaproteobacteria bacterium]|nr:helix-turn-helix domain-containing protein [Alphaproteobacteria bacterium]MDE2492468.1 helix-turn-helix domain-containing protein [Alphaproteobacteria bacterium]